MSEQDNPQVVNAALLAPSVKEPTLQRKCACGNHTIAEAECESCKKEKGSGTLQRAETSPGSVASVPPIVNEVLDSPGQPLDQESRSFFEPRFGRDFSRVRVHTDAKADDSAKAVNARAYTVGQNLVFQEGQFTPGSSSGKKLLAHELAHVVQQRGSAEQSTSGLRVDEAGSPAEAQADAASEAALRGSGPANIAAVPTMISRTPDEPARRIPDPFRIDPSVLFAPPPVHPYDIKRVETVDDDNRRVFISTGQRYLVKRLRTFETKVTEGRQKPRLSATPGMDRQKVWLEIDFCEGATEGSVQINADIPDQVVQAIISAVQSGGNIDAAIGKMQFTPAIEGKVRTKNWKFTAKAQTTLDTKGEVQGVEGEFGLEKDTPAGTFGGKLRGQSQKVGDNPLGGGALTLNFEWSPPGDTKKVPDCRQRKVTVVEHTSYICMEETTTPARDEARTREKEKEDRRELFLYFEYAKPKLDSRRSAVPLSELRTLLGQDYRVTEITGFTSPEGSKDPQGKNWEGNEELSRKRAKAAGEEVQRACKDKSGTCFETGVSSEGEGKGELYTLMEVNAKGELVESKKGPEQADEATKQFKTKEAEEPHRTPDVEKRLEGARTPKQRADIVYPLLRRALIKLRRMWKETEHYVEHIPEKTNTKSLASCPKDIKDAAFPPDKESSGGKVGPRR